MPYTLDAHLTDILPLQYVSMGIQSSHILGLNKCMHPFTNTMRKKRAANGAIKAA